MLLAVNIRTDSSMRGHEISNPNAPIGTIEQLFRRSFRVYLSADRQFLCGIESENWERKEHTVL